MPLSNHQVIASILTPMCEIGHTLFLLMRSPRLYRKPSSFNPPVLPNMLSPETRANKKQESSPS